MTDAWTNLREAARMGLMLLGALAFFLAIFPPCFRAISSSPSQPMPTPTDQPAPFPSPPDGGDGGDVPVPYSRPTYKGAA